MKKILILVFTLFSVLILTGCKDDPLPGERGSGTRYVYKYSYDDYKELCDNSKDYFHGDGRDLTEPIPDYQFEGVVKKVYEIPTLCSCTKEERPGDNKTTCPNYIYRGTVTLYCYTDENNAFMLSFKEPMDLNFAVDRDNDFTRYEESNGEVHYMATIVAGARGSVKYIFNAYQTTEEKTYHVDDTSLGTHTSNYTEEEIKYWFDLTFNTMKEYHKEIEGKD